jgi:hypothetical protein
MKSILTCVLTVAAAAVLSAQTVTSVVSGTIKEVDVGAKTVAIVTATGAQEVIEFSDKTVVHPTAVGAKDVFKGLKQGTQVAARYTGAGAKKVATEVYDIGKGGLKVIEGTVTKVDEGARIVAVKTADGAVEVFNVTETALMDVGKGAATVGKVTVHYTEEGGKKVAYFFKRL